jgi:signal transduction histidine kinase/ActR/RegA family two-component response regulator
MVYANRAMLEYLGYDSQGTLTVPTLVELSDEIIHPGDRQRTRAAFQELFAGLGAGGPGTGWESKVVRTDDVRLRRRGDAALRFCDIHGVLVMHDGRPAVVTMLQDQTERRAAADRIRLADRMSSLGTLAAGVAHEINNPLTYVIGNLDLVAARLGRGNGDGAAPDPELAVALGRMQTGLDRIRRTVRALKTFTRADEETLGAVDVARVLDSCIEMVQAHLRHRGRVVRDYAPAPAVRGNEARLGQVFLNLLVNAADALDERQSPRNEVRVAVAAADGQVTVEVRDNGCGIAPEVLPRVFDPFFTTKPVGVGTGLGLFVSHEIVAALGGDIAVDSVLGQGTWARVRLPAAAEAAAGGAVRGAGPQARARVLVIDDEPLVLDVIRRVLQHDHDVETESEPRRALQRLLGADRDRFALILCDLMMPDLSGAELVARLRAGAPDVVARVAFMTGGAVSPGAEAALGRAAHPTLEKPFEPGELLAFVNRLLAASAGGGARAVLPRS